MITSKQLKIFEKYDGDPDGFTHASRKEKTLLNEEDFFILQRLISDLKLIGNGVAAESYKAQIFEQMNNLFDNDQTREYLVRLSKTID